MISSKFLLECQDILLENKVTIDLNCGQTLVSVSVIRINSDTVLAKKVSGDKKKYFVFPVGDIKLIETV